MRAKLHFAHLSDPHLVLRASPSFRELASKRILGFFNWKRNRHKRHLSEVLTKVTADIAKYRPDLTVVTGDVTNISLPEEFNDAKIWLNSLGTPEKVVFLPGNHDAYVPAPWDETLGRLAPFMVGERDAEYREPADFDDFPFIRRQGPVGFVFLNSAPPMPPGFATGRIGREQCARVKAALVKLSQEGLFRVVALHHPPVKGVLALRKSLTDANALCDVLRQAGAELVIHGHGHKPTVAAIDGPNGEIPVYGVASASYAGRPGHPAAQYHLFTVTQSITGAFRLELEVRGLECASGPVTTIVGKEVATPAVSN